MKNLIAIITLLISFSSQAAVVHSARYIAPEDSVELDVSYGGGCAEHKFELELHPSCRESYPVQCDMTLHHDNGGDMCEAYIHRTVKINVNAFNLTESYFNGAYITVFGDGNSKATFNLPFIR